MPTITKRELVIELSNRCGMTQTQVFEVFQASLDLITEELAKGNEVTLRRFGTFEVRVSKPKIGRNPNKPGSDMPIPARTVVKFKPGKEMKAKVAEVLTKIAPAAGGAS